MIGVPMPNPRDSIIANLNQQLDQFFGAGGSIQQIASGVSAEMVGYTKHRGLLVQVFAFAVAKGLCERNSAELTLVKKEAEKKRQRHTFEGLNKILGYVGTPVWLKRAIRLGLLSFQRREDIVV